ncbi:MAG: adenosine deaminase, partial [Pseudomonadota bacterium]
MSWREYPKIELHLHLEGAAPPAFIRGLAAEKGVDLSAIFTPEGGYAYRDFEHF